MIRTAFSELDIVCLVDPENQNSIRLLKKLGFQEEAYYEAIHSILFLIKADATKQQNAWSQSGVFLSNRTFYFLVLQSLFLKGDFAIIELAEKTVKEQ